VLLAEQPPILVQPPGEQPVPPEIVTGKRWSAIWCRSLIPELDFAATTSQCGFSIQPAHGQVHQSPPSADAWPRTPRHGTPPVIGGL